MKILILKKIVLTDLNHATHFLSLRDPCLGRDRYFKNHCLIATGYRQLTHDVFFSFSSSVLLQFLVFFVIILLSFREQLFQLGQMALELSCDEELSEALRTSQAADLFNQPSELCDQIINSMTNNVINCEYMDIFDKTLNLQNDSNAMILMHLNIRSL